MFHGLVTMLERVLKLDPQELGALLLAFDLVLFILLAIFWKAGPPTRPKSRRRP